MGENKQIWVCKHCEEGPCFQVTDFHIPRECCEYRNEHDAYWEMTDDYEITEKKKVVPESDFSKEFPGGEEIKTSSKKRVHIVDEFPFEKKTPNCAVCRWKAADRPQLMGNEPLTYRIKGLCAAQGWKYCTEVYNTSECKALFEMMEEK